MLIVIANRETRIVAFKMIEGEKLGLWSSYLLSIKSILSAVDISRVPTNPALS